VWVEQVHKGEQELRRLTQKQTIFSNKYFELGNATEAAKLAGYSPRTAAVAGSRLLRNVNIDGRLTQLQEAAKDASVASVLERKQVLTEALRITPEDIMELSDDSRDLMIKPEALKSRAVAYIRTEQISIGKMPVRISRIGLMDKVRAAAELNKMERIYEAEGGVTVDNRTLIINVGDLSDVELARIATEGFTPGGRKRTSEEAGSKE